jgi:hypothetical protein
VFTDSQLKQQQKNLILVAQSDELSPTLTFLTSFRNGVKNWTWRCREDTNPPLGELT